MKSRPAVLYGLTRSFSIEKIEVDQPKEGKVQVKLVTTGFGYSDWHFATWAAPVRFRW